MGAEARSAQVDIKFNVNVMHIRLQLHQKWLQVETEFCCIQLWAWTDEWPNVLTYLLSIFPLGTIDVSDVRSTVIVTHSCLLMLNLNNVLHKSVKELLYFCYKIRKEAGIAITRYPLRCVNSEFPVNVVAALKSSMFFIQLSLLSTLSLRKLERSRVF